MNHASQSTPLATDHPLSALSRRRLFVATLLSVAAAPAWSAADDASPSLAGPNDLTEIEFSSSFTGSSIDLSRYARQNFVSPGAYRVDVRVNGTSHSRQEIQFRAATQGLSATACFRMEQLLQFGIDLPANEDGEDDRHCASVDQVVPGAFATYDPNTLQLDLSVPQVNMKRQARGYVAPSLWDRGTVSGSIGYSAHAYRSEDTHAAPGAKRQQTDSVYVGLNNGLNVGGWRVRHRASAQWQSGRPTKVQGIGLQAQHDITPWRAQLTVGDTFSSGQLLPSTAVRGVNVRSDTRMLPDSQNGYAPVVRGVAQTQARVTIEQNGYLLHEQTVAPGAFEIDDLYPTGQGSDLLVTVTESDGRFHTFTVPFASAPQLLRPGNTRFEVTAGQLRSQRADKAPYLLEGTLQRGVSNSVTAYGGIQATHDGGYRSVLLGAAFNTAAGALSFDLTGAKASLPGLPDQGGYSLRLGYAKTVPSTRTQFTVASYRYTSDRFLPLSEAVAWREQLKARIHQNSPSGSGRPRSQIQVNINQPLPKGSFYLTASHQRGRASYERHTTFQAGYSTQIRRTGINLSASRTLLPNGRKDNQYHLSMSVPLGSPNMPSLNTSITRDARGVYSGRAGMFGALGKERQVNFGLQASATKGEPLRRTLGGNLSWTAPYANLGASHTYGARTRQTSASASGGVVFHRGGVTLARQLGETMAVVEAKGAEGARINGSSRVDHRGYAVISGLTPYRHNEVSLDTRRLPHGSEFEATRTQVTPRAGAIVAARFDRMGGRALLIRSRQANGEPLPFGAQVFDESGADAGMVGQGGQIYVRTEQLQGRLLIQWGAETSQRCHVPYSLDSSTTDNDWTSIDVVCEADSSSINATNVTRSSATQQEDHQRVEVSTPEWAAL